MKVKNVPFKRRLLLEEKINAGESIAGISGFVPAETKCCSGGATHYLPVVVQGIKLGDCEFSVLVAPTSGDVICFEERFTINPKSFFQSKEEIAAYLAHLNKLREYNLAMAPFQYNSGTRLGRRNKFKAAYEETTNAALKEDIDAEAKDAGGLSKLDTKLIADYYKAMMMAKFFPNYGKDFDPDIDDEEDDVP